jgi:hypothetical protein
LHPSSSALIDDTSIAAERSGRIPLEELYLQTLGEHRRFRGVSAGYDKRLYKSDSRVGYCSVFRAVLRLVGVKPPSGIGIMRF